MNYLDSRSIFTGPQYGNIDIHPWVSDLYPPSGNHRLPASLLKHVTSTSLTGLDLPAAPAHLFSTF